MWRIDGVMVVGRGEGEAVELEDFRFCFFLFHFCHPRNSLFSVSPEIFWTVIFKVVFVYSIVLRWSA